MTTTRTKVNNSVLGYISNLSAGDVQTNTITVNNTGGSAEFKGITTVSNATDATNPTTAAFKVSGGAAVQLKLVVGGNGYIGDSTAGSGFAGLRQLRVSNMTTDQNASAEAIAYCDRAQVSIGSLPRNNLGLPDATYLNSIAGSAGKGLFITETSDDTGYIKLGVGSTAYTSPAVTVKKSGTAASDKTSGTLIVTGDMGVSGDIYSTYFRGTATAAQYQDVAEKYVPDAEYEPGTVVIFGGEKEITQSTVVEDRRVAGVISTAPAYMMGSEIEGGVYVALLGRVPCKVMGYIRKGDLMVTSHIPGVARASSDPKMGTVIGKALEDYHSTEVGVIEVVVGRV